MQVTQSVLTFLRGMLAIKPHQRSHKSSLSRRSKREENQNRHLQNEFSHSMTSLTLLALLGVVIMSTSFSQGRRCPKTLPQDVKKISPCYITRKISLAKQKRTFKIKPPSKLMPFARFDITYKDFFKFLLKKPFLKEHATKWITQAVFNQGKFKAYVNKTSSLPSIVKMREFAQIAWFFKRSAKILLDGFVDLPSQTELFRTEMRKWISDKFFAEQRLAGLNPMTLKKIALSEEGANWDELKRMLNSSFDWEKTISGVLKGKSLDQAINEGYLYVLHHPLSNGLKTVKDEGDHDPHRKMWKYMSPIALFASVPGKTSRTKPRLMPVAIQMDYKPDSPVYTPKDGDAWMMAKLNVQLTDLESSQIEEHLGKVHMVSEGLCLSIERQLSKHHPLYAIMKYHCRGVLTANTVGGPTLLIPDQQLDFLFPYGFEGSNILLGKTARNYEWKDLEFHQNIKQRGLDDVRRLPYYPYRDDGAEIYKIIKYMATDYVDAYYRSDEDVREDNEVQSFANEVSDKGTKPGGAKVKIPGFPAEIKSKEELVALVAQIIWLMSGQHVSINYPLADYGMYAGNIPLKLYDDDRLENGTFGPQRLPNRIQTAAHASFSITLASYRHDRLFDYAPYLEDPKARAVVFRYFSRLNEEVEPMLERRNKARFARGYLTYPYMLPRWIPNGIQT